ncbi:antimicrobial protein 6Tox [Aphomia sociella]
MYEIAVTYSCRLNHVYENNIRCFTLCYKRFFVNGAVVSEYDVTQTNDGFGKKCIDYQCTTFCNSIGYIFGHCNGNSCICTFPKEETRLEETVRSDCNDVSCEDMCHNNEMGLGQCLRNRCFCDKTMRQNTDIKPKNLQTCDAKKCNDICRKLGFASGDCLGDKCNCHTHITVHGKVDSCSPIFCEQACRRLGVRGGVCVGNKCKCDLLLQNQETIFDPEQDKAGCDKARCNQLCKRMGFHGGKCFGNKCKCDVRVMLESDSDEETSSTESENDKKSYYFNRI